MSSSKTPRCYELEKTTAQCITWLQFADLARGHRVGRQFKQVEKWLAVALLALRNSRRYKTRTGPSKLRVYKSACATDEQGNLVPAAFSSCVQVQLLYPSTANLLCRSVESEFCLGGRE